MASLSKSSTLAPIKVERDPIMVSLDAEAVYARHGRFFRNGQWQGYPEWLVRAAIPPELVFGEPREFPPGAKKMLQAARRAKPKPVRFEPPEPRGDYWVCHFDSREGYRRIDLALLTIVERLVGNEGEWRFSRSLCGRETFLYYDSGDALRGIVAARA